MKKVFKIIAWVVGILILFGIFGYYKSVGFTKKQKYENCAETCEKIMLQSSNIPLCKMRCTEITGYDPASAEKKKKKPEEEKSEPVREEKSETATVNEAEEEEDVIDQEAEYYCEWSWPQKIIEKSSGKVVFRCSSERPWCDSSDRKYENVGCCGHYDEDKKIKTDCIKLPDLLKKQGY